MNQNANEAGKLADAPSTPNEVHSHLTRETDGFCSSRADVIVYRLAKANRRRTSDILWQREDTIYRGADDGDYFIFEASNGYQVISRSGMHIQTERLWLIGAKDNERSRPARGPHCAARATGSTASGFRAMLLSVRHHVPLGPTFRSLD
jgi:hypothetical protein